MLLLQEKQTFAGCSLTTKSLGRAALVARSITAAGPTAIAVVLRICRFRATACSLTAKPLGSAALATRRINPAGTTAFAAVLQIGSMPAAILRATACSLTAKPLGSAALSARRFNAAGTTALFPQRPKGTRFSHPPLRSGRAIRRTIFALPCYRTAITAR